MPDKKSAADTPKKTSVSAAPLLHIRKTVVPDSSDPCAFSVTLSAQGAATLSAQGAATLSTQGAATLSAQGAATLSAQGAAFGGAAPVWIVFAVDATPSMQAADPGCSANRQLLVTQAVRRCLDGLSAPPYAETETRFALVTFGIGAHVHRLCSELQPGEGRIGSRTWNPAQFAEAKAGYDAVSDKSTFFYPGSDLLAILGQPGLFEPPAEDGVCEATNPEAALLLSADLLRAAPPGANKGIVLITDGEANASSSFYTAYREADAAGRIRSAQLLSSGGRLYAKSGEVRAPVTGTDLVLEGIEPGPGGAALSVPEAAFLPETALRLKLRAFARSEAFYSSTAGRLPVNPFAGERHNFDARDGDGAERVPTEPDFSDDRTLNGWFWSNGLVAPGAEACYSAKSPLFRKDFGIWKFSSGIPGGEPIPVYTDRFWTQSPVGWELDEIAFDYSPAERRIFSTGQKLPETRLIDSHTQDVRLGSRAAAQLTIDAARSAQDDGIVVEVIVIGTDVPLLRELDEVSSAGHAFAVPCGPDAAAALAARLLAFTDALLHAANNVVITENLRRREALLPCADDNSFTIDVSSIRVAFQRRPGDPVVSVPVDPETSPLVSLTAASHLLTLSFYAGTLWPSRAAVRTPGRITRASLTYRMLPNPGVCSRSPDLADIPSAVSTSVNWTFAGADHARTFRTPKLHVARECAPCLPGARREALTDIAESVALVETALSHMLNTEGENLRSALENDDVPERFLAVSRTLESLAGTASRFETLLGEKLRRLGRWFGENK